MRMPQTYLRKTSEKFQVTFCFSSYPSSIRNSLAEPESLEMNIMVPIGIRVLIRFWATMIGPMVLFFRWSAKSVNELGIFSARSQQRKRAWVSTSLLPSTSLGFWRSVHSSRTHVRISEDAGIEYHVINSSHIYHGHHIANELLKGIRASMDGLVQHHQRWCSPPSSHRIPTGDMQPWGMLRPGSTAAKLFRFRWWSLAPDLLVAAVGGQIPGPIRGWLRR